MDTPISNDNRVWFIYLYTPSAMVIEYGSYNGSHQSAMIIE